MVLAIMEPADAIPTKEDWEREHGKISSNLDAKK